MEICGGMADPCSSPASFVSVLQMDDQGASILAFYSPDSRSEIVTTSPGKYPFPDTQNQL